VAPFAIPAIALVGIDLDGTLFDSQQRITARTAAVVQAARVAGIEICIATGRRHPFAWRMLDALDLPSEAVIISSNGAVIRERGGRLLLRTQLDRNLALQLCREVGPHRERLVFTFDRVDAAPLAAHHPGALLMETSGPLSEIIERWITQNRSDILELPSIEDGLRQDLPIQAMVCGPIGPMRELEEHLGRSSMAGCITVHRTEYVRNDLCIVDILPAGLGKGVALAWLAGQRGLDVKQIAAIGDNYNDVDMLEYAGAAYLMANAAPDLLALAAGRGWRMVPSNDQDGAAIALEEILQS
jgi:hydroxymethylpyrimidine pyrophosphatase-like HAD family hydrolase